MAQNVNETEENVETVKGRITYFKGSRFDFFPKAFCYVTSVNVFSGSLLIVAERT